MSLLSLNDRTNYVYSQNQFMSWANNDIKNFVDEFFFQLEEIKFKLNFT